MNKDQLSSILASRAKKCIELSNGLLDQGTYYLAGSAIASNEIRDIDIYPVGDFEFIVPTTDIISKTKNSTTINNNPPLQFCSFQKPSLSSLISSFDFSHIQAGVRIDYGEIKEIKWTEEFLYSKAAGTSSFEGSDFPLSSAIRLLKYYKRGEISDRSSIACMLEILSSIVDRGFKDYEDFKDQLDSVDLGLIPEEIGEIKIDSLRTLFNKLDKVGEKA